jgi:hypothetical protein
MKSVFEFLPEYGNKELKLADGSVIGHLPKDPRMFVGYSTIYYGSTGSGKSTAILEQLHLIRNSVDRVVTFSPTNDVNMTYNTCQPLLTIHRNLTFEKIRDIFEQQKKISTFYAIINKMEILEPIFHKMKSIPALNHQYYKAIAKIGAYRQQYAEKMGRLRGQNLPFDVAKNQEAEYHGKLNDHIRNVYKNTIIEARHILLQNISDTTQIKILQRINMNPNLLIIMDDCIEEIYQISKKHKTNSEDEFSMDTLFSKGRHFNITIIIAAQDDNKVLPAIKKNTYISIFTEAESANHFAESKSNAFTKEKKKKFQLAINAVFNSQTNTVNHKKLVYCMRGQGNNMFTYKIADVCRNFRVGSEEFWNKCLRAQNNFKPEDADRQFIENFS